MEDDLKAYFAENADVKKAYIDGVKANNTDGFVVVLELENENNVREIADHVAKAINKYGSCVVAPISSPIGKKVLERKTAFTKPENHITGDGHDGICRQIACKCCRVGFLRCY